MTDEHNQPGLMAGQDAAAHGCNQVPTLLNVQADQEHC